MHGGEATNNAVNSPAQSQPTAAPGSFAARPAQSGWTLPLVCAGIALIACCVLIPAADENRRIMYETEKLKADLEQIQRQTAVNDEFIKRMQKDPTLAERLAQRQMQYIREGTRVIELKGQTRPEISPFFLTAVPEPPPMPEYEPVGGRLAQLCRNPRSQLYTMGVAMMLMAAGLVLGASDSRH